MQNIPEIDFEVSPILYVLQKDITYDDAYRKRYRDFNLYFSV